MNKAMEVAENLVNGIARLAQVVLMYTAPVVFLIALVLVALAPVLIIFNH